VEFVQNLVQKYGDIVKLPFGDHELYVLNHPDFIRDIFVEHPDAFAKRKDPEAEQGYLTQISGILPLLDASQVPQYAPFMVRAAERAHRRWQMRHSESGPFEVDIYRELGRITLEVVVQTLFGVDAEQDAKDLLDAMLAINVGYGFNPIEVTLQGFLPPAEQKLQPEALEARMFVQRYMESLVERSGSDLNMGPLLSTLRRQMGTQMAASAAMTVMFAMHEVTNTTLPWTCYLLSQHPEVEARVHAELGDNLGGRNPEYRDIAALSYTNMMLEEVRRLYPSVWIIGRFVRKDHSFRGNLVRAGSIVLASQRVVHRDPRYFPDPDRFDPMRWTAEARKERPEFSYFPFSAGPRACAGEAFAKAEDTLIIGTLAQKWRARAVSGLQPEAIPGRSDAPYSGVRMTLEARSK
jgi:cytochrome P450